ncbi:MAG: hypothetical protein ACK5B9_07340 [Flavobacteriia bacterium]|jgi:tetratricopeptide (TPR) repeat protein
MSKTIKRKKPNSNSDRLMSILTFGAFILIIWEISIFRKTFISLFIPLTFFLIGGLILFFSLRKKIKYYIETDYGILLQAFHGTILFGSTFMFIFMSLNFYFPTDNIEQFDLRVIKTGNLASRRGCDNPFTVVDYQGFEKQLVFPCNTDLHNAQRIKVKLQAGLFGFKIVNDAKLVNYKKVEDINSMESELEKQYLKILIRAEEYYDDGNIEKTIELYERAVQIKPSDKLAKIRLKEIKNTPLTPNKQKRQKYYI